MLAMAHHLPLSTLAHKLRAFSLPAPSTLPLLLVLVPLLLLSPSVNAADNAWEQTAAWSPLSITLLVCYIIFGCAFYAAAYTMGVYARHPLAFTLGVVGVAFAVDFDSNSLSKPVAIGIMLVTGIVCVILVHLFRWARYLFIGFYVGILLSLALPDLCVISLKFGALAFPAGVAVGLLGVYYGYKAILFFSSTLGALWLLKVAAILFIKVYQVHFLHRASTTLSAYFFPSSGDDSRLPPVPFFVPLALVLAALVLAVPRIAFGVIYHRHRKSASSSALSKKHQQQQHLSQSQNNHSHHHNHSHQNHAGAGGSSSSSSTTSSPTHAQAGSGGSSPTLANDGSGGNSLSSKKAGAGNGSQNQLNQSSRTPSSSSIAIRKSGSTSSMSSLSARQRPR